MGNFYFQRLHKISLSILLTLFSAISLHAITISGTVRDSATQTNLADVLVTTSDKKFTVYSDALGHFRVAGQQAGKIELQFFILGYETKKVALDLVEGEDKNLAVTLIPKSISLTEVTVSQQKDIGQSISTINEIDKTLRPTNSAQDLLRLVPGLFIAQHAGGGKAEQIFLRGFDSDHGTDFAVFIDGIPVNMVSHAHGQGYADFHFVIPETVDKLKVSKGPYAARYGDFATSGAGEFFTKNAVEKNEVKLEYGMFDTYRAMGMFNLLGKKHLFTQRPENFYLAGEYCFSNSYFESPQHFNRYNVFTKYTGQFTAHTSLSFSASTFSSRWDASGQIPGRAIDDGSITRFGTIDNTEGGETSRTNANLIITTTTEKNSSFTNQFYYSYYTFNLYSNFTFFLSDSVNGDGINQRENGRNIFGYNGTYEKYHTVLSKESKTTIGIGTRIDNGETSLNRSVKRNLTGVISSGMLFEENIFAYIDENIKLTKKLSLNAGLRSDNFIFDYKNYINDSLSGRRNVSIISPKLSFFYSPNENIQFFLRSGYGYHSNDARGVVSAKTGNALPRALGYEFGSTFKAGKKLLFNIAAWGLDLENELVYVGDEGVVEINGPSRRLGMDLAVRYEILPSLFADADLNYNYGRLLDLPNGHNYIPLAPSLTSTGGITYRKEKGFSASLRYRYIDSRPANEDNTVTAQGYFLLDAVASYKIKNVEIGISGQNLLNSVWNEAQFDTESRLKNESMSVSELHFTPGTPFFIKGMISVKF
jgi:hypothetical protein